MEKNLLKIFIVLVGTTFALMVDSILYDQFIIGDVYKHQNFIFLILSFLIFVFSHYLFFKFMKNIISLFSFLLLIALYGCADYAQSNQQTVYTDDCGVTWSIIKTGEKIPKCAVNCACFYTVRIPDYPMDGDSEFKISFKGKVVSDAKMSYSYSIEDPLLFIKEAKYIARANTQASDSTNGSIYEKVENTVIDSRLKEISREIFNKEDIVEYEHSQVEELLLVELNKKLESKGVRVFDFSFVLEFDEQTRQAIDIITANKIYESRDLSDLGKAIMVARASSSKITVESK